MKQTSLKSNFVFNLIYQVVAIITPIITTPYISRVLGAEGNGRYSYALSIVTYFGMFGILGITTYGQLKIAQCRDDEEQLRKNISEIMTIKTITMLLSIICYGVIIATADDNYRIIYMVLLFFLLQNINDVAFIFQGLEMFKTLAIRNLIIKIVNIAMIFMFVKDLGDIYIYVFIIHGVMFIGNFFLWPKVFKYFKIVNPLHCNFMYHLKESFVYFVPTIATSVYTVLDKSMIGWITKSEAQNGYYEQAHKIEQILVVLVTALGVVTLPRMAYLNKNKDRDGMKHIMDITVNFIMFISLPMCVGLFAVAPVLVPCFLGDGYEACIPLVRIFSLLIIIVGLDNTIGKQCLVATNRQRMFNIGVISGAVLNFLVNMCLIPVLGANGAAISSVCAEGLILTLFLIFSCDMINFKPMVVSFIKYGIIAAVMGVIVWLIGRAMEVRTLTLVVQIAAGVAIYFVILIIIRDEFVMRAMKMVMSKLKNR